MDECLTRLIEGFRESPVRTSRMLRDLAATDRERFCDSALKLLSNPGAETPGHHYLAILLVANELMPEPLCDPAFYGLHDDAGAAKQLAWAEVLGPPDDERTGTERADASPRPRAKFGGASMDGYLQRLIDGFAGNPDRAGKMMRDLAEAGGVRFCDSALRLLSNPEVNTSGHQYMSTLLAANELLSERLCNPARHELQQALALASRLARNAPFLDVELARRVVASDGIEPGRLEGPAAERALEILAHISGGTRILPFVARLLNHSDQRIRSKATLLAGRSTKNIAWAAQHMGEMDPRVRANTVEALWGVDLEGARLALLEACRDPHNRVQGNALVGLYRLGEVSSMRRILDMANHDEPRFRITAAWVMGETGDPRFLPALTDLVRSGTRPQGSIFRAITRIRKAQASAASGDRLCVGVCQVKRLENGSRRLRASISSNQGQPVSSLAHTRLVIWEDRQPVFDYAVQPCPAPELLAVGLVLPARGASSTPRNDLIDQALAAAWMVRRSLDRWAVVRYDASPEGGSPGSRPDLRVTCVADANVLKGALKEAVPHAETAPGATDGIRAALAAVACVPGSRNLIVCGDPLLAARRKPPEPAEIDALVGSAQAAATPVHGIGLPGSGGTYEGLRELCERTGGAFLRADMEDRVPELFKKLYLSLLHRYEILYQAGPAAATADPRGVKLQVFSPAGYGEDTLP